MPAIESPQNRIPKLLRALHTKKGRAEHGLALVEGPNGLADALAAKRLAFLAWCPDVADEAVVQPLLRKAERGGIPVHELTRKAFAATADTATPTGLLGAAGVHLLRLTELSLAGKSVTFLALHEIRDPGNAGTMIRSADAFGARAVIAVGGCVDLYDPKVVRATAGATFRLPLAEATWDEFRAWTKAGEVSIIAADLAGKTSLPQLQWPARSAILIGNEAHGLPPEVASRAGVRVKIPMPGRAESLNAAVAAGIMLYAANNRISQGPDGEK
jgi:RNA methyltransferase, TrmH family